MHRIKMSLKVKFILVCFLYILTIHCRPRNLQLCISRIFISDICPPALCKVPDGGTKRKPKGTG